MAGRDALRQDTHLEALASHAVTHTRAVASHSVTQPVALAPHAVDFVFPLIDDKQPPLPGDAELPGAGTAPNCADTASHVDSKPLGADALRISTRTGVIHSQDTLKCENKLFSLGSLAKPQEAVYAVCRLAQAEQFTPIMPRTTFR